MFLRRKKKCASPEASLPPPPAGPGQAFARTSASGAPLIEHLGDLWHVLQSIAAEEDARFETRTVVEHLNASAEGRRDVLRWLAIYERRIDPERDVSLLSFTLPPHLPRHGGHALLARNWPEGIAWEAIEEATLRKAPLDPAREPGTLRSALDAWIDGRETSRQGRSITGPPGDGLPVDG